MPDRLSLDSPTANGGTQRLIARSRAFLAARSCSAANPVEIVLALGGILLLSTAFASSASADRLVDFTVSPQRGFAPLDVTVTDNDAGATNVRWDCTYTPSDGFQTTATGSSAVCHYSMVGKFAVAVRDVVNGQPGKNGTFITVADPRDKPAAINLVKPCQIAKLPDPTNGDVVPPKCATKVPVTLEFTTPKSHFVVDACHEPDANVWCRATVAGRTGPDRLGRYHYFVSLDKVPHNGAWWLDVKAWSVQEGFADWGEVEIDVTGTRNPLSDLTSRMRTLSKRGATCHVASALSFKMASAYQSTVSVKVQRKRHHHWHTIKHKVVPGSGFGSDQLQSYSAGVSVRRSRLHHSRTKVEQKVWDSSQVYQGVSQTQSLNRHCRD